MMLKLVVLAATASAVAGFVAPLRTTARPASALHVAAFDSMDQLAAAAQKCVDGRCDVYERDAVIKNMLETRKDMRSEMAKINIFLKEIGYIDDENDIVNFTLKGALRALFGRSKNEPPAANTDGYATGFSGDVTPTKDFFRWDWHWKNPSFTRSD